MNKYKEYALTQQINLPAVHPMPIPAGTIIKVEEVNAPLPLIEYDPQEVIVWLAARGWSDAGTKQGHATRRAYAHTALRVFDLTWEQAVAYETFRFLNMGVNQ